jgi:chromosome segregation ATPase
MFFFVGLLAIAAIGLGAYQWYQNQQLNQRLVQVQQAYIQLQQERDQLIVRRDELALERNQLILEREQLRQTNAQLTAANQALEQEKLALRQEVGTLRGQNAFLANENQAQKEGLNQLGSYYAAQQQQPEPAVCDGCLDWDLIGKIGSTAFKALLPFIGG